MRFAAACLLAAVAFFPHIGRAQINPGPYSAAEFRGRITEAGTGHPVEGAVVVARWEWMHYYPGGIHSSARFDNSGEILHVAEATTDAQGRFVIPRWGPVARTGGRMADGAPRVFVFKPGFVPLQLTRGKEGADHPAANAALARSTAAPADHARALAEFQEGRYETGLHWRHESDNWRRMPNMVMALHREKARLGDDGYPVLGVHLLHGRSGKGELRWPKLQERAINSGGFPPTPATLSIAWTLRRDDGGATKRFVQQRRLPQSDVAQFWISPWRFPQPGPPGWSPVPDAKPMVRVYAGGYRALPDVAWGEEGASLTMEALPETRETLLAELRRWRRDIDAEANDAQGLASQFLLLRSLNAECNRLTLDARKGICFEPGSEAARLAERSEDSTWTVTETEMGDEAQRRRNAPQPRMGSPIVADVANTRTPSVAITGVSAGAPGRSDPRKPVGGFVIKPVAPAGSAR